MLPLQLKLDRSTLIASEIANRDRKALFTPRQDLVSIYSNKPKSVVVEKRERMTARRAELTSIQDSNPDTSTWRTEDWWANWLGVGLLSIVVLSVVIGPTAGLKPGKSLLTGWVAKPAKWGGNLSDTLVAKDKSSLLPGITATGCLLCGLFALGNAGLGRNGLAFIPGFVLLFGLALLAFTMAEQELIRYYNLEYPLWGLFVGLLAHFVLGTNSIISRALQTEFYIKTGLVLLGIEVLLPNLVALGLPGICVSWVVTPVVLITTFVFGQRVFKMESPSLNMVISADMSVCGVSAAIATGAACRAKKEEISMAISLSLVFTVIMMVVQPFVIRLVGMHEIVAGAWLGGTIDSTGAVAAAGTLVGKGAEQTAITVKMIQNILIGVVAFGVATYWVTVVERSSASSTGTDEESNRPSLWEIWYRFPKFMLGFLGASVLFSVISASGSGGEAIVAGTMAVTKELRGWLFGLAFVSIGLEISFSEIKRQWTGGKPLVLYVCGQLLNLVLTLAMAWLMFGVVFRDASDQLLKQAYPDQQATQPVR